MSFGDFQLGPVFSTGRYYWCMSQQILSVVQPRYYYYVVGPALCDYIAAGSDCQVTLGPWEWSSVTHCGAVVQPRYYYYVVGPALCDYIVAGSDCQVAFGPW